MTWECTTQSLPAQGFTRLRLLSSSGEQGTSIPSQGFQVWSPQATVPRQDAELLGSFP